MYFVVKAIGLCGCFHNQIKFSKQRDEALLGALWFIKDGYANIGLNLHFDG